MARKNSGVKQGRQQPTSPLQRFWHFIWYDDSAWSWAATLLLAFILIKFIVYPLLALAFGTQLPIVAVISGSMDHQTNNFDRWWSSVSAVCGEERCTQSQWYGQQGISKEEFEEFPLHKGFARGDVIVLVGSDAEDIEVGDVIVYKVNRNPLLASSNFPIIHRVVDIDEHDGMIFFGTKGDGNEAQINETCAQEPCLVETSIPASAVIGKAVLRIPLLGYVKLLAVDLFGLFGVQLG